LALPPLPGGRRLGAPAHEEPPAACTVEGRRLAAVGMSLNRECFTDGRADGKTRCVLNLRWELGQRSDVVACQGEGKARVSGGEAAGEARVRGSGQGRERDGRRIFFQVEWEEEPGARPEEEGARFGSGLFGSRAMCGKLYDDELNRYKDKDGISFAEAMREYGLDPSKAAETVRKPGSIKAFVELHIEQGPILENEKVNVGIVESIVGLRTLDVFVHGRSDHAGNTPLNMRADTFLASAKAVCAGTEKAVEIGENTVFTCGYVTVEPGAFNIVTKETHFQIDCRSKTLANVDKVLETVRASLDKSCAENPGLSYEIDEKLSMGEVPMNEGIKSLMEKEAAEAGITTRANLKGLGQIPGACDILIRHAKESTDDLTKEPRKQ